MTNESSRRLGHAWVIGVLLLTLWAGVAYRVYSERESVITAKTLELDKLTVAVEEQSLRLFKMVELSVFTASEWIRDHPDTFPSQDAALAELVAQLRRLADGAIDFRIVDASGGLHLIPAPTRQPVANIRERQSVQVQLDPQTRGFFIGDPVVTPVDGKWIIPVTAPVMRPDGAVLIVAAILELDRVTKMFEPQRLKPNGSITLLKTTGVTLFRTPAIEGSIGKSIAKAPDFIEHLNAFDRGHYRVKGAFDGVERLVSHARMPNYPIIIAVTASLDDALLPWRTELITTLILLGVTTLLCLFLARRIHQTEQAARLRLEGSERRFRALIEHAPDAILLFDVQSRRIVEANSMLEKMFACSRETLKANGILHFYEPVQPDGLPADESVLKAEERALAGESVVVERWVHNAAGRRFSVEVRLDDISEDDRHLIRGSFTDISERKAAEKILRDSERQIRLLFNSGNDAIIVYEADSLSGAPLGRLIEVNDIACSRLGYTREELMAMRYEDLLAPECAAHPAPNVKLAFQRTAVFETVFICKEARLIPVEINAHLFELNDKAAVLAVARDITERKRVEKELHLAASVFDSAQEGIIITNAGNHIINANAAFTRITGYTLDQVLLQNPKVLQSGHHDHAFYGEMWAAIVSNDHWQGELWNRRRDGELYAQRLTVSVVRDSEGRLAHYVGILADITLEKRQKELLEHTAHYDALTGIPNRVLLADRMRQALAQTFRSHTLLAICYIDLDGFKPINDTLGHLVGDQVLVEVASRFRSCLRGGDTAARIGGDEFVLLLSLADKEECGNALQRVLEAVAQPLGIEGCDAGLTASIGVTLFPDDNTDADTLLRHADHAMYQAKQGGKNRYCFYNPDSLTGTYSPADRAQHPSFTS